MGLFDKLFKKSPEPTEAYFSPDSDYGPPHIIIKQIQESMDLVNNTLNPRTFFSRYQVASNKACSIMKIQKVVYNGMTPIQLHRWLNDEDVKSMLQRQFIDRLFDAHRENSIVYQMNDVGHRMTRNAMEYYLMRMSSKKFHFCKVKFDINDKKTYTYVTKDKNLAVGDTVTVYVENMSHAKPKVVQVIEVFDDYLEALPFNIEELRCIDSKLKGIECPHCGASIQVDVGEKRGKCDYCGAEFYLVQMGE